MLKRSGELDFGSNPASVSRLALRSKSGLIPIVATAVLLSGLQSACLFKKGKAPKPAPAAVRVVFLPLNAPAADEELRWAALAAPIMMAIVSERARDLDVVPLWQSMPIAVEAAGASRTLNAETAANVASWFSAKWSAMGELVPDGRKVSLVIDFIPSTSSQVPFRYMKAGRIDTVGSTFPSVFTQFLHYLSLRPLLPPAKTEQSFSSLRNLAEALDVEYGWFADAQPGKAQRAVSGLADSDMRLARLLFSPTLYPLLTPPKTD
jgi:hypothetical protein